jgi:uncharacterized protein YebE (UPF0316 family)
METSFFNSDLFSYVLLPLLIFMARICDVSIDTVRIIYVSKGKRNIVPFLGFFQVLIWIIAMSKIMQNLDNYVNYIAYAGGFATGNFIGMIIEEKLAVGIQMVRVFAHERGSELVQTLNKSNYGATVVDANGARGKVHLIYIIVQRNELSNVVELINRFNPKAFFTIEDVKAAKEGIFAPKKRTTIFPFNSRLRQWGNGK